ncbi:MAG TPA: valine--tRNA ligase, partial [Saprospiraceae bacterium]|nr:valine--tRNA ligase [Saprospiraceae bacterium]
MLSEHFTPKEVEEKWYQHWMEKNYFHSEPDDREPFTIVIPPPNVTGVLHMGHMLNNTIQDILIRKARLDGKNACWVPGTDHASIATEAKVVKQLREMGIKKSDLSREEFLEHAWQWKEKYGGIILQQLRKLGASCDWERTAFTMDESCSKSVIKVFVDLYHKGKLYRGLRMVNWDPEAQTVLSNEEVLYKEENSKLYYVRYQIEGTSDFLTIATTRPETIPGDSAVAVNPKDERYQHLKNQRVIIPIVNRSVPIIFDDYVDVAFGTGALKITPAHDINDYEIGKRHELEVIDVLNDNGTMSEAAQVYIGEDRAIARKKIAKDLEEMGQIVKVEDYLHSVGRSERTNSVVEPKLSLQWYVDMKAIASPALDAVMKDEVEFFPKKFKNTYRHWMENIRDWCISRQLWWGHRIPAYFYGEEVFVAETAQEALAQAQEKLGLPDLKISDLKQDEDVLDTWFSSWLWPISVFDGFNNQKDIDYYYPTNVLVTGWDIIFLWVARMVMAGYEWKNERPFEHVYFTGMVRDKQKRKMSKSLGNSPDALKLIADFGADGVRFGMMSCSPAGGDLLFDEKLCKQGKNYCNKMWNALKLLKSWKIKEEQTDANIIAANQFAIKWFKNKLSKTIVEIEANFKDYRLSEALITLYSFMWNDFFQMYLEIIKPPYGEAIDRATYESTIELYSQLMTTLHPFMPFVTEEIWHQLKDRKAGEDCVISTYPKADTIDKTLLRQMDIASQIISNIRDNKNKNKVSKNDSVELFVQQTD